MATNAPQLMPQLYQDLISLCSVDDSFYYKDIQFHSIKYRVFNYRLGSYTTFHSYPSALNCRGVMFNMTDSNNVKLVCLPPEKFFNYEEGNGQQQHENGRLGDKMEKLDGSLISTFLHINDEGQEVLRLKSKASITSQQALEAMQLLTDQFKSEIEQLVRLNYTVNMEYTSPSNRIVLHYPQSQLTVLSIRSHSDGQTLFGSRLTSFLFTQNFFTILKQLVPFETIPSRLSHKQLVEDTRQQLEGEGYVVEIIHPNRLSYLVKIKTHKYLLLHQTKDSLNSPRRLFEIVINEHSDDLRSLFHDDNAALEQISIMEQYVRPQYNRMVESIEQFYKENKHLSRKEYAQLVMGSTDMKMYLGLLMNLYQGKENDYKVFAIRHAKDLFGIKEKENMLTITNVENDE